MDKCIDCKINKRVVLSNTLTKDVELTYSYKFKGKSYKGIVNKEDDDIIEVKFQYDSLYCAECYKNHPIPNAIDVFNEMASKKCIQCKSNNRLHLKDFDTIGLLYLTIHENYGYFCTKCINIIKTIPERPDLPDRIETQRFCFVCNSWNQCKEDCIVKKESKYDLLPLRITKIRIEDLPLEMPLNLKKINIIPVIMTTFAENITLLGKDKKNNEYGNYDQKKRPHISIELNEESDWNHEKFTEIAVLTAEKWTGMKCFARFTKNKAYRNFLPNEIFMNKNAVIDNTQTEHGLYIFLYTNDAVDTNTYPKNIKPPQINSNSPCDEWVWNLGSELLPTGIWYEKMYRNTFYHIPFFMDTASIFHTWGGDMDETSKLAFFPLPPKGWESSKLELIEQYYEEVDGKYVPRKEMKPYNMQLPFNIHKIALN